MTDRAARVIASAAARLSTLFGGRAMRVIARVNRLITNPAVRLGAGRLPYLAVIAHRGRRSGTRYRTPVMAFVADDVICVVLNYGARSDWVRNVLAAGTAEVDHRRRRYVLTEPEVLSTSSDRLPPAMRDAGLPSRDVLRAALTLRR